VGGCVRDLLLGREPEDWDVATSARPEDVEGCFSETRQVGRSFGVVQVESSGDWIEVATFRTEGTYRDGRHPETVRYSTAREDAERRDFTVNALFLDPETDRVLDWVGGRADLEKRLLRCVGDSVARFGEDGLRLLRAVRFACRLGFEIEPSTWGAMTAQAAGIAAVSGERVRDELVAILTGPDPRRGMTLLYDSGLLRHVLPEIAAMKGVDQSPTHHPEGDVWEHTLRMLDCLPEGDPELALGVLLHDVGKPVSRRVEAGEVRFYGHVERGQELAGAILDRLRLPVRTQEAVQAMIGQHMRFIDTPRMKRSTLRRFVLQEHFPRILELHRLDALSARGDLSSWELCQRELRAIAEEAPPVRSLLTGHDLMALGFEAGPRLGEILHALVDAQLEGDVTDHDGALAWVRAHYRP
jgi:poly(A) polymerase